MEGVTCNQDPQPEKESTMNSIKNIIAISALALFFGACSSDKNGSEANAEILPVEGIAATGYALANASVSITDANGEVLFTGTTDALGAYLGELDRASIDLPLIIQVTKGDTTYEHVVPELPATVDSALVAHANPITDMVARAIRETQTNMEKLTAQFCDSVAQVRIQAMLGEGAQYGAFANHKGYVAAVRGDSSVIPSSTDMILHTLGERAAGEGMELGEYLREQVRTQARLLTGDAEFQAELTVQMQKFGMDSAQIQNGLRTTLGGEGCDSLVQKMEQMRDQYRQYQMPSECLSEDVQAQIQEALSLQIQMQGDSTNVAVQTQLTLTVQTLNQLRSQCQVHTGTPDSTGFPNMSDSTNSSDSSMNGTQGGGQI